MRGPEEYGFIYLLTNTVTGKRYIGQTTSQISYRWSQHCSYAIKGLRRTPIATAIKEHGRDAFTIEKLATASSQKQLDQIEIDFISHYRSGEREFGYNVLPGGRGRGPASDAVRAKLRGINVGKKRGPMPAEVKARIGAANRGRKYPIEIIRKHSDQLIGRKHSEEHRKKISESNKGRVFSEETRRKISAAQIGKVIPEEVRKKLRGKVISPEVRRKRSEAQKARMARPEDRKRISDTLKGNIPHNKGKPMPAHQLAEMIERFRTKGHHRLGYVTPQETRDKISAANRGKSKPRASEETKRKMSESQRARQQALTPEARRARQAHRIGTKRPDISAIMRARFSSPDNIERGNLIVALVEAGMIRADIAARTGIHEDSILRAYAKFKERS